MTSTASTPRPSRSSAGRHRNQPSTLTGTPPPKILSPESLRKKLRYIPGGPGGGGRYVDEDGTEIPVGGTGPGGHNYVGPRGPIGRANAAAGLVPVVNPKRERTPRPSRTTPSRSRVPTTPRFATAAHASAIMAQSEDYKPREERAMEEFHPDLDIYSSLKVFSADEVDGKIPDRPITPAGALSTVDASVNGTNGIATSASTASSANGDATPAASTIPITAISYPGTPGFKRGPGRPPRDPVKFYAAKAAANGLSSPTGMIPTTPKNTRITPLPNQTAKERLTLPQPSHRKVSSFPKYKGETPEIEKLMVEMGYRIEDVFVRPENKYIRTEDSMVPEGVFRVEYDMDEDDAGWLKVLNRKRKESNLEPISPEIFEILITKIELEWNALEKRIPKPNPKPPQTHRPRSSSAAAVNGEPQAGEEQDSKCAICDDGDCENTNAIVFCDGCDLAVHQDCYGVPFIPEGQWLCRKCHLIGRGIPTCLFCPNTDGAFKQTNSSKWAHLLCAMWIPEVSLGNHSFMEPVQDVEKVPKNRWELKCYICKQNMGACVQCGNKNCYEAFHVTCARKAKLYLKMKNSHGTLSVLDGTSVLKAFCHKHSPKDYQRDVDAAQSAKDAIEFYKKTMKGRIWASSPAQASAMAAKKHQKMEHPLNQSQATGARIAQVSGDKNGKKNQIIWRLDSGAPVIPKVILDKVIKDMERFSIQSNDEFVAQMTRFWTLKRESRGGAPLIKRLGQNETSTAMEMTRRNFPAMGPMGKARLHRRTAFGQMIDAELDHLSNITAAYQERARIQLELAELQTHAIDTIYFPLQGLLIPIIDKAISSDHSNTYKADLTEIKQKIQNRHYVHCLDLARDISALVYNRIATKSTAAVESPVEEPRTSTRKRKRSEVDEEASKEADKIRVDGIAIIEACTDSLIEIVTVESQIRKKDVEKMILALKSILAGNIKTAHYDSDEETIIEVSIRGAKTEESEEFVSAANSTTGLDTVTTEKPKPASSAIENAALATGNVPSSHTGLYDEDAEGEEVDEEDIFAPVPTGSPQVKREQRRTSKTASNVHALSNGDIQAVEVSKNSFTPPDTNGSVGSVSSLPDQPHVDPPTPASSASPSSSSSSISLAHGGPMWYLKDFKPVGSSVIEPEVITSERDASEELTDIDDEQLKALGPDADADVNVDAEVDVDVDVDVDVEMGGTATEELKPEATPVPVPLPVVVVKKNARRARAKGRAK